MKETGEWETQQVRREGGFVVGEREGLPETFHLLTVIVNKPSLASCLPPSTPNYGPGCGPSTLGAFILFLAFPLTS